MPTDPTLRALAASLAGLDWTVDAIAAHLARRLPRQLRRLAPALARRLRAAFPGTTAPDAARIARALAASAAAPRLRAAALLAGAPPAFPVEPPRCRPLGPFAGLGLPELATCDDLAGWLGLTPDRLVRFADLRALSALAGGAFAPHYRHHLIAKRDGSLRLIEEPKPFLKRLQLRLLHGLLDLVPPHSGAAGFRRGASCIAAAARHAGEEVVLGFDLGDFFPGIDFARVYAIFRSLGYPAPVARALAGLCTAVTPPGLLDTPRLAAHEALGTRHLPQGAPTSPAPANLAAFRLDARLAGLARSLGAAYTRYADDLTFSGDARIRPILLRAVPEVVAAEGFRLNPAKTRIQPAHDRQVVTGLTVNRRVNVARKDFDLLKATLHHLADPSDARRADAAFLATLSGRISWVEQVNPARGRRLRLALDALGR